MYHFHLRARPSTASEGPRPWGRPQLEALEDRLVPSIAEGTILVSNSPANDYARGQTSYPSGIIGVDPNTGMPIAISVGAIYQVPQDVKEAPANTPNVP